MRLPPTGACEVATAPRCSVPLCGAARSGRSRRHSVATEIVVVYVTALVCVVVDLCVFHWLSGWLTALLETVELAPILAGAWFYWTTRTRRLGRTAGIPKVLYVPVLSTAVQLQILLLAQIYGHLGFT